MNEWIAQAKNCKRKIEEYQEQIEKITKMIKSKEIKVECLRRRIKNPVVCTIIDYLPIDIVLIIDSYETFTVCELCNNLCPKKLKKCHQHLKLQEYYGLFGQMQVVKQYTLGRTVIKFNDKRDLETFNYLLKDTYNAAEHYSGTYENFENVKGTSYDFEYFSCLRIWQRSEQHSCPKCSRFCSENHVCQNCQECLKCEYLCYSKGHPIIRID